MAIIAELIKAEPGEYQTAYPWTGLDSPKQQCDILDFYLLGCRNIIYCNDIKNNWTGVSMK